MIFRILGFCRVIPVLLVCSVASVAQAQVAIRFDGSGLASVNFEGSELLSSGVLTANGITFEDGTGGTYPASLNASVAVDAAAGKIVNHYAWGDISAVYRAHDNRLDITLEVTNRGSSAIRGVFVEPLAVRLPVKPAEYDNVTPMMAFDPGDPGVVALTCPTVTVVLGYEDPGQPILAGFPFAYDRPASTIFPLRINTDHDPGYPTLYPTVNRPIAPGQSDQYHFSLRFGSGGSTVDTLAADVYSRFVAMFPPILNWMDRRPIGQLVLATSAAGYATNPRGWLLDPTIDITTTAGLAEFKSRILAWADQSVGILKQLNAQGMITWDIEGEQFPQPTSYLCDPAVLAQAAPEMNAIADEYFAKFTDAGLRVGVCVRPQHLVLNGSDSTQQTATDPAQVIIDKIAYAKSRWSASLFYVDSNGDPNLPIDAEVFRRIAIAHPDVLVIPEHENTRYYAYTAPYRELRQNQVSTPAPVGRVYPSAFGVTYVADGDFARHRAELIAAVERGDLLMTRAWFPDPANAEVAQIYAAATKPASPPSVSITAPGNGASVSGTVTLTANATSMTGIRFVQFRIDGVAFGAALTAPPYSVSLNTATLANGPRTITATTQDGSGNTATADITINVNNALSDVQPPVVTITPAVSGVVSLLASALDNVAVTAVRFRVDGVDVGTMLTTAPYSVSWDTTTAANGIHAVTAVARDAAGNESMATSQVTVSNAIRDPQLPASCDAVPTNTFLGCYYKALDFAGLVSTRIDPTIDFKWGDAPPLAGMNSQNYTIRWQGKFAFTDGGYQFVLTLDDGARLYVDGTLVWDVWGEHWAQTFQKTLQMTAGDHVVRLDYVQFSGKAEAGLTWSPMGR